MGSLERLKWFLWHGNVYKALQVVQSVEMNLDAAVATSSNDTARKRLKVADIPLGRSLVLESQESLGVVVEDLIDVLGWQA